MFKLLVVVAIIAAVTYLVTRYLQDRTPGAPAPRRTRPSQPPRAVAPDDDDDFLRDLDRKRKRRNPPDPED